MKTAQRRGFTLIELLTVIAIIAILMGMVVVGMPRVLEKAKIADVETDMKAIHTALTTYMADNGSYPPRYGYLKRGSKASDPVGDRYYLLPYTAHIDLFQTFDVYDRFSLDTHDTNSDGVLQPLEFCPSGVYNAAKDRVEFRDDVIYSGPGSIPAEEAKQFVEQGPYVYLPVNTAQFKKLKKTLARMGKLTAQSVDWPALWPLLDFQFPPPKYDAFVLISIGPGEDTFGILSMNESGTDAERYHKMALRAYYLATRDINNGGEGNGELDNDHRARTQRDESKILEDEAAGLGLLPNGQPLGGPLIGKFE